MLSFKRVYDVLFLATVMFPHELKIQAFLIIYCHWEMFWLASHVATPVLKHSPILLYVHTGPIPFRAVMWKAGYDEDSFIKDSHLITPKSGRMNTQEKRLFCSGGGRSDLRHTSNHKPLSGPRGSPFTWTGFQSSLLTPKRFPPRWCVSAGLINLFMY